MKSLLLILLFFSSSVSFSFQDSVYLIKKPSPGFIKTYHKNFFLWLNKNHLKNNALIKKCFDEWMETEGAGSWEVFSEKELRPFYVSFIKETGDSGLILNLISKSPLSCLNGANGAKWKFSGELVSKFYLNQKQKACDFNATDEYVFEVKNDNSCLFWNISKAKKIGHIVFGFTAESSFPISAKGQDKMHIVYYKDFNPFVLDGIPKEFLEALRVEWRSKISGARLFGENSYELIWH